MLVLVRISRCLVRMCFVSFHIAKGSDVLTCPTHQTSTTITARLFAVARCLSGMPIAYFFSTPYALLCSLSALRSPPAVASFRLSNRTPASEQAVPCPSWRGTGVSLALLSAFHFHTEPSRAEPSQSRHPPALLTLISRLSLSFVYDVHR